MLHEKHAGTHIVAEPGRVRLKERGRGRIVVVVQVVAVHARVCVLNDIIFRIKFMFDSEIWKSCIRNSIEREYYFPTKAYRISHA